MFFRQDVGEKFMQFLDWKRGAGFSIQSAIYHVLYRKIRGLLFIDSFQTICMQSFAYFLTRYCVYNTIKL